MRRVIGSSLVISSVIVAAGALAQTPAAPTVKIKPQTPIPTATLKPIQIPRPPSIANARRALKPNGEPDTSPYTDGPLSWEVEIVNPNAEALQTRLLVKSHFGLSDHQTDLPPVPVSVPASSRAWVKFTDPKGILGGCNPNFHQLKLEAGGQARMLSFTPACMFAWKSRTLPDPLGNLAPDRKVAMTTGKMWFHSAKVLTRTPTCSSKVELEATVGNAHDSQQAFGELWLDNNGPGDPDRDSSANGYFSLAPRREQVVRFTRSFEGRARAVLKLQPQRGGQVPAFSASTWLETTRLCRITSVELK